MYTKWCWVKHASQFKVNWLIKSYSLWLGWRERQDLRIERRVSEDSQKGLPLSREKEKGGKRMERRDGPWAHGKKKYTLRIRWWNRNHQSETQTSSNKGHIWLRCKNSLIRIPQNLSNIGLQCINKIPRFGFFYMGSLEYIHFTSCHTLFYIQCMQTYSMDVAGDLYIKLACCVLHQVECWPDIPSNNLLKYEKSVIKTQTFAGKDETSLKLHI